MPKDCRKKYLTTEKIRSGHFYSNLLEGMSLVYFILSMSEKALSYCVHRLSAQEIGISDWTTDQRGQTFKAYARGPFNRVP